MLDLNRFKDINDFLGHACGDAVLREVAARLRALVGDSGLVARLGADEFAIVIAGPAIRDPADRLATAIHRSFAQKELADAGMRLWVTFNIGVALFPHHSGSAEQLLADADLALVRGKAAGAGLHMFFDPAFRSELETRLWMRSELERAYERGEFELFYQPQIRLHDSTVVGAEALIRWNHPERGLVSPGDFIPILDTTPIAAKVARWVMESACRQGARWLREGHEIRIGVNLSPSQFRSGDLAAVTSEVLAETGFPPALLELEVTENILLADDQRALAVFGQLRDLGVHLAWDDFGTGYASLTYLKKFPLNRLKIDQLFVRDIAPGSNDAAIVEYTINLARTLGLAVIAEGVETKATADLLARMGCEEAQGYYFGRPSPVGCFEKAFLGVPPAASEAGRSDVSADAA
jgi:diguanylate cyclase (GGDEF)-like protein